jgi:hypothetical protein
MRVVFHDYLSDVVLQKKDSRGFINRTKPTTGHKMKRGSRLYPL